MHSGHPGVAAAGHRLKRPASKKHCIELFEERVEIDGRVHDDPVRFAVRPSDVPIQTSCYCIANTSHEDSLHCQLSISDCQLVFSGTANRHLAIGNWQCEPLFEFVQHCSHVSWT